MRTIQEVRETFAYHPATPDTAPRFDACRTAVTTCAEALWDQVPDGPDRTRVMRALQDALMRANFAIAMTSPIAEPGTADVARVLP